VPAEAALAEAGGGGTKNSLQFLDVPDLGARSWAHRNDDASLRDIWNCVSLSHDVPEFVGEHTVPGFRPSTQTRPPLYRYPGRDTPLHDSTAQRLYIFSARRFWWARTCPCTGRFL